MENSINKKHAQIFTTGAFIKPMKTYDVNKNAYYVWVVDSFEDDSYRDEKVFNPPEYAYSLEELLVNQDEQED